MNMSFLRWAGSKKKLLKRLLPYWQASGCGRYVEPFAGSAMLFFAAQPQQALLADTNEDLIEMYRTMQRNWQGVFREVSKFPCTERFYYELRNMHVPKTHVIRRAARFIYLNRFCLMGFTGQIAKVSLMCRMPEEQNGSCSRGMNLSSLLLIFRMHNLFVKISEEHFSK